MSRKSVSILLSVLVATSMLLAACAPAATPAPATEAPKTEAPAATEVKTEAAAATEIATEAPKATETVVSTDAPSAGVSSRVTYGESDSYYTFDVFLSSSQYVQVYMVYDPLFVLDPEFKEYHGVLAKDWKVSDDSKTITINLRDDVKFTDGTPVNADAIKYDLDVYRDPKTASSFGGWMTDVVEDVVKVSDYTLDIKLKEPYAPFFYWMSQMVFPSAEAYKKLGPEKFALEPVGSGQFMVKEIIPDVSVTYVKNPDYKWYPEFIKNPGPSKIEEFQAKFKLSGEVIYAQLETGEIDVAAVPSQMIEKAKANPKLELFQTIQSGIRYLGFNTSKAPYDDPKFRKALAYGINREELIQVGYEGEAMPVHTPLSPSVFGWSDSYDAEVAKEEAYNPEMAKKALEEAGYKDVNGDGKIEGKDGKPMLLKLQFSENTVNKLVSETIQSQLTDLGLNVELVSMDSQTLMDATKQKTHDMIFWSYGLSDCTIFGYLFKSNRIGASNRMAYNSPEIDKLINIMESTMNPEERKLKAIDVMKHVTEFHPMIPLLAENRYYAFRKDKFSGIVFDKSGTPFFGDAEPVK